MQLPTALVQTSTALQAQSPAATLASWSGPARDPLPTRLANARAQATRLRRQLIAWQEELDWQIYEAFGLMEGAESSTSVAVSLPEGEAMDRVAEFGLELGERAFEIVLARRMAAGEVQTTWFERHGSTPITEVPAHWPAAYRELVERRIQRIADDPNIRLIEQPEYKRRWNTEPWDEQLQKALRQWLLLRLEGCFFGGERMAGARSQKSEAGVQVAAGPMPDPLEGLRQSWPGGRQPALVSTHRLADCIRGDAAFLQVAKLYRGRPDFDLPGLVAELVEEESVPFLPAQRYKESGLRNRRVWEEVWDLQRREDAIDAAEGVDEPGIPDVERERRKREAAARKKAEIGDIPVPPKYASKDFKSATYWKLRGKLDVPKERWISYPGAERGADSSRVIAWAGWDHLQQAKALAGYLEDLKNEGASDAQQLLLLAGLAQLVPWLLQWHNDVDLETGERLGDYFRHHVADELRRLGKTDSDLQAVAYGEG